MTSDPDFVIRGMAEYHVRLIGEMARQFYRAEQPAAEGTHIFDVQQQRWRFLVQLVEDCIREAYFRGAEHGLSLASMTKYMVVTAEQMEAIKTRIDEEYETV